MAKKRSSSRTQFSTEGFARAYDVAGTSPEVEDGLRSEGFMDEDESGARRRSSRRRSTSSSTSDGARSSAGASSSDNTMPASRPLLRKKGRRAFVGRHFRLPIETNDQLVFLAKFHDCYLLDVVKLAIHNEWLRATREKRRRKRGARKQKADGGSEQE